VKESLLNAATERLRESAGEPGWLAALRKSGAETFRRKGFPTAQDKEWVQTSVQPLTALEFSLPNGATVSKSALAALPASVPGGIRLVFLNGLFRPELSNLAAPAGVTIHSLKEFLSLRPGELEPYLGRNARLEENVFTALNTALFSDGAYVRIAKGAVIEGPIELTFLSTADGTPVMSHPRNVIVAEEGSQASLIETYGGARGSVYWINPVTELFLGPNARISHLKVQEEETGAFHIASTAARQAKDSLFDSRAIQLGGRLVRNNIETVLAEEGAECDLNGLFVLNGGQHSDTHTLIDHATAHCSSRELYKGILGGNARGVFDGKIVVRPDAQKTNAMQNSRNLLLSKEAQIDTTPRLEILADDVKCAHGATIGSLDEQAVFYLRSRGIDEARARAILTSGFANEIVDAIPYPALRGRLTARLSKRLSEELP
jgi:Fe-S cluster assembly protein SufD